MSNGLMSYGVNKVTPVHSTMLENSNVFVTLQKGQDKVMVDTTGIVYNFIILLFSLCTPTCSISNCWRGIPAMIGVCFLLRCFLLQMNFAY